MSFSVITPSFRQLAWLRLCVASIFDQRLALGTDVPIEHVIQDGGSTEIHEFGPEMAGALGLIVEPAKGGECFVAHRDNYTLRIYQEPDRGMYDALQKGLEKTNGQILSWLNCDEQYPPEALALVLRAFRPDADLLCGDTILLDPELVPRAYRKAVMPAAEFIQAFQLNLHSSSLFFRRSAVERYGFLPVEFRSISDAKWIHRLIQSKARFQILPKPLSYFILGEANLSAAPVSFEEKKAWADELALSDANRRRLRLGNNFHRLLHGAYFPRLAGADLFTPADLLHRKHYDKRWLDFRFRTT